MANENTYIPHLLDVSHVEETPLLKAFADTLAEAYYRDAVSSRVSEALYQPTPWGRLSEEEKHFYTSKALYWSKFLEARYGLDAIFGGDNIRPDFIEEALTREFHEVASSVLLREGWIYGIETDMDKKITPSLVPFDDLPYNEKSLCSRNSYLVCSVLDDFAEIYEKGIDTVDDLFPGKSKRFNIGFGFVNDSMLHLLNRLEMSIGWKSSFRHYDFKGVSGFYPVISDGKVEIMHGDKPGLRFYPKADGGIGMDIMSDVFSRYEGMSPINVVSDLELGRFCLDPANVELLKSETHKGHEVIYGLRYGESAAFSIPTDGSGREDTALLRGLAGKEGNIRIVDSDMFSEAIDSWLSRAVSPGFEPSQTPKLIKYFFDGETVFSEREKSIDLLRVVSPSEASDWNLIDALIKGGDDLRHDFQFACGVDTARRFKFDGALYPSPFISEEALFLCSKYGAEQRGFLTALKGKVCYFKSMDAFMEGEGKPSKVFPSVKDGLDYFRSIIMSKENLMIARSEYAAYKKGNGIHV